MNDSINFEFFTDEELEALDKNLKKTDLKQLSGISSNILAKLGKNEPVAIDSLEKLCVSLNCNIEDIFGLIRYQMNCGFAESLQIVSSICGIKSSRKVKKIDLYMRKPKRESKEYKRLEAKILNEK